MNDPIADLLTRIRNAAQARHQVVNVPSSKIKKSILNILKDEGYISNFVLEEASPQDQIKVFLKYDEKKKSVIHKLSRVSRPGGRVYRGYREIKPFLRGLGLRILSTPKGLLTDKQARKEKVGGEVLCEIW